MIDSVDLVNELTNNGEYANEACLLLLINNEDITLNYLHHLNIKGKDLETLYNKCCFDQSVECLVQTTRYLMSGFLNYRTIFLNLRNENPIIFIDRLLAPGEDWNHAYEKYTANFYKNLNNSKSR